MADVAFNVRTLLAKANRPLMVIVGLGAGYLIASAQPGGIGLVLMAVGTFITLNVWIQQGIGLPMLPVLVVQHLLSYGLPILIGHETVGEYPEEYTTRAGIELLVFNFALAGGFTAAMQSIGTSPARSYALDDKSTQGTAGLGKLGFSLIWTATLYQVLDTFGLTWMVLDLLPAGTYSIFIALIGAVTVCGFFLASMVISHPETPPGRRVLFWVLLALNCLISASTFLLSATTATIFAVAIGLFWGSGRMPLRYLAIAIGLLAFLNLGKFDMRGRYWNPANREEVVAAASPMGSLGGHYFEWIEASLSNIGLSEAKPTASFQSDTRKKSGQSLLERVNNLQNLLFVMDVMKDDKIDLLMGKTYALIPALLVPRILWPEKPRTHEGQVLLATHFGRQDLASTFTTYIAWGLLPEAYGNFGPFAGSVVLGLFLGFICGWIEKATARKPVLSTEGFVAFVVFLMVATSFEMVSTVLVTTIFQAIIPVVAASLPFTRQQVVERPHVLDDALPAESPEGTTFSG